MYSFPDTSEKDADAISPMMEDGAWQARSTAWLSLGQTSRGKEDVWTFEFSYTEDILGIGPKTSKTPHVILCYFLFVDGP